MSQVRWRQISSANLGFALPEKILIPPVVLIRSLPISDCQLPIAILQTEEPSKSAIGNWKSTRENIGWGGWIRTNECRFQRPVPYHLATPQYQIAGSSPANTRCVTECGTQILAILFRFRD